MDTRRRLPSADVEQSNTVGPAGQGRRHGKKDKRSKLGTLWVLAVKGKDPADIERSDRERPRGSDEAIVSDDLAGQNNPRASQGPLDRHVRGEVRRPPHSGRRSARTSRRTTTAYKPAARAEVKVAGAGAGLKPYRGKPAVRNFRGGRGNVMHGLAAICHEARKGGYTGSRWSTHRRASPLLDQNDPKCPTF